MPPEPHAIAPEEKLRVLYPVFIEPQQHLIAWQKDVVLPDYPHTSPYEKRSAPELHLIEAEEVEKEPEEE